jgi:flagellar biosynthesis protein FliR
MEPGLVIAGSDLEGIAAALALVAVRFLGLFLALPMFALRGLPMSLRVAPVLAIAFALWPEVLRAMPAVTPGPLAVITEFAIGATFGLSLRVAMLAIDVIAESLGIHTGLAFGQTISPDSVLPSTALGEFIGVGLLAVLFAMDAHLLFVQAVADSFRALPPGAPPPGQLFEAFLQLLVSGFSIGVVVASGSFALYLMVNFVLGAINRISPQLNLMTVGFSANAPLALVVLALLAMQMPVLGSTVLQAALDFLDAGGLRVR